MYCLHFASRSRGCWRGPSTDAETIDFYSSTHSFHVELWNYIKRQSYALSKCVGPQPQKSFHVQVPEPDEEVHSMEVALESTLGELSCEDGDGGDKILNGISGFTCRRMIFVSQLCNPGAKGEEALKRRFDAPP